MPSVGWGPRLLGSEPLEWNGSLDNLATILRRFLTYLQDRMVSFSLTDSLVPTYLWHHRQSG